MLVNHGEETIQAIRVGEIHIHVLDWEDDSGCSKSRGLGLLPREEQVEYSLIRPDERRREFRLSRLFLRRILAGYLHQEESSLRFIRNPRGKPTLAGSNLQFNLAHTAGRMVCSVGWTPVGIDVEKADPQARPGWRRLAERFFTPEEKEYLFTQPSGSQPLFFFRIFTMKEAYGKALGIGLGSVFRRLTVPLPIQSRSRLGPWEFFVPDPDPEGYCMALVAYNPDHDHLQYPLCDWGEEALLNL